MANTCQNSTATFQLRLRLSTTIHQYCLRQLFKIMMAFEKCRGMVSPQANFDHENTWNCLLSGRFKCFYLLADMLNATQKNNLNFKIKFSKLSHWILNNKSLMVSLASCVTHMEWYLNLFSIVFNNKSYIFRSESKVSSFLVILILIFNFDFDFETVKLSRICCWKQLKTNLNEKHNLLNSNDSAALVGN